MLVRNRPCACGSGRLARDCCGRFRRLSSTEIAAAYLGRQARQAREVLGPFSASAVATLQAEAATLPDRCDVFEIALGAAHIHRVDDTPAVRVALAKAVLALRESGTIDEHLAAAAILDLTGARSQLCDAARRQAAAPRPAPAPGRPVTV
jgi:hypothetical protein